MDFLFKRPVCRPYVFAGRLKKPVAHHPSPRVIASGGTPLGDPEGFASGTHVVFS